MKRRIAIIASGVTSPLYSVLEFATRLRANKNDVRIFAPATSSKLIKFAGFDHCLIADPKIAVFASLVGPAGPSRFSRHSRRDRLKKAVSCLGVDGLADDLTAYMPDLIIVDCELHAHIIVALSLNLPVVQSNNMFLSPPSLQAPPLHKNIVPGRGFWGSKPGVLASWSLHIAKKTAKIYSRAVRYWGADQPSALYELAKRRGVNINKLRRTITWQIPWTYRIPTIIFLPQALDLPTHNYPDVTFLGSMIWQDRPSVDYDNAKIAKFCADQSGIKKIYVAFGTRVTPDDRLVSNIFTAVGRHPEWRILCVVGSHWRSSPQQQPPKNVEIVSWAPQTDMLKVSDLAILHGGTGGLIEAVDAGTPMLIYPKDLDQFGSAARAEFHGIGRGGNQNDTVDKIERDVMEILNSEVILSACTKMQAACRHENDSEFIENYILSATRNKTSAS